MSSSPIIQLKIKPARPVLEPSETVCAPPPGLQFCLWGIQIFGKKSFSSQLRATLGPNSSTYNTWSEFHHFNKVKLFSPLKYLKAGIMLSSLLSQFLQLSQKRAL